MGFDNDLHHCRVQRVALVNRSGAPLHVVDVGTLVGDDEGSLELAHVLGVDPEVGLQWDVDVHARRNVDEGAARPHRGVEGGELVVACRDHCAEVLLEDLRVLPQAGIGIQEDDALGLQVLPDLVVHDLRLVLSRHAGDQPLLLGLRDAEAVVGVLDVLGEFLPRRRLLLGGAHEVLDVVEVDAAEVRTPVGHRLLLEGAQRTKPDVEHPFRLALLSRDVADHRLGETALRACACDVGVGPAVAVATE